MTGNDHDESDATVPSVVDAATLIPLTSQITTSAGEEVELDEDRYHPEDFFPGDPGTRPGPSPEELRSRLLERYHIDMSTLRPVNYMVAAPPVTEEVEICCCCPERVYFMVRNVKNADNKAFVTLELHVHLLNEGAGEMCRCRLEWVEKASDPYGGGSSEKREWRMPEANTWYDLGLRHQAGKALNKKSMMSSLDFQWDNLYCAKSTCKDCHFTVVDRPGEKDVRETARGLRARREKSRTFTVDIQATVIGCSEEGCSCSPKTRTARARVSVKVNSNGTAEEPVVAVDNSLGGLQPPGEGASEDERKMYRELSGAPIQSNWPAPGGETYASENGLGAGRLQ